MSGRPNRLCSAHAPWPSPLHLVSATSNGVMTTLSAQSVDRAATLGSGSPDSQGSRRACPLPDSMISRLTYDIGSRIGTIRAQTVDKPPAVVAFNPAHYDNVVSTRPGPRTAPAHREPAGHHERRGPAGRASASRPSRGWSTTSRRCTRTPPSGCWRPSTSWGSGATSAPATCAAVPPPAPSG